MELNLRDVFFCIIRKLWLVILMAGICGAGGYALSEYVITPQYTASASMYVFNANRMDSITSTDLTTSQKLVQTYIVVLTSNSVLEEVSAKLNNRYSIAELRAMISATAIDSTEAFRIYVKNSDPNVAMDIANTIASVAPEQIIRVVKAGSVEVIDYASLPVYPSYPSAAKFTILGAMVGAIAACIIAIVTFMADTAIHSEEELMEAYTIPILGVIPNMDQKNDNGGEYNSVKQRG